MIGANKKVSGRRVYVTFDSDGTATLHSSNCTGSEYKRGQHASEVLSETDAASAEAIGLAVLRTCQKCRTE
jgi:hypothetical protein